VTKTFINADQIQRTLDRATAEPQRVCEVLDRAREQKGLSPEEVAVLLRMEDADTWQEVFRLAREIKQDIYGRRIVLFAPLYVSNFCANDCVYCAFRRSNAAVDRRALTREDVAREVEALERAGHKRLLMVFGEHPKFGIEYMTDAIRAAYEVKTATPCGEIRRVNINAAPMNIADYRALKQVGIGTYQVFQETYHPGRYAELHPAKTRKADFAWRLYALHRAQEAGLDDVAVGALFGLYDWRFEILGLLHHALDLEKQFGVGPHTVSFPRLQPAINTPFAGRSPYLVRDDDFKKAVAIIRLMVPYTGMILTCREKPALRHELFALGVSQIDGGTRIGVGGYQARKKTIPERQQFTIHDTRTLDEIVRELVELDYLPSFCTSCYRSGRTGDDFMRLAKAGGVKHFCQPNAMLTFKEYLLDYASPATRRVGDALIERELAQLAKTRQDKLRRKLKRVEAGERDVYY
jgi:2-iminoacetate synthase